MNAALSVRLMPALVVLVAMIVAPMLAEVARPNAKLADQGPKVDLEEMIPKQFGNWRVNQALVPIQASPDVQAELDKIYNQVLSRTYSDHLGRHVMLSIAYGGNQADKLSIHLPEGCYGGQGFAVGPKITSELLTPRGDITVARLIATKQSRVEPITYWMVIAGKVTTNSWDAKKAKLAYTLKGDVPGGMLIRISSISGNAAEAFKLQQDFASELFASLPKDKVEQLIGSLP
jgi:EpsI family protein